MKKQIVRILCYPLGLIIKSFGITQMIRSHMGTDAWNSLYVGMYQHFGLTVGTWVIVVGVLIILLNARIKRKKPGLFPLVTVLILGLCIDFWLGILPFSLLNRTEQVLLFWAGLLCTCLGIAIYVQGRFGLTPCDELMYNLCHRFEISLSASKTVTDGCALLFALLLQGPIALGTLMYT
ncbi:MAG: DUF6198 family protein, partial [Thermoactinomyces sp.]